MIRDEACSNAELGRASRIVHELSDRLKGVYKMTEDVRILRAELILEEAAEILESLSTRDEILLFDGLVDLLYVSLGTAVTYDLPIEPGFAEVHGSNMTKGSGAAAHSGDKGKVAGFKPADVQTVLARHRAEQKAP